MAPETHPRPAVRCGTCGSPHLHPTTKVPAPLRVALGLVGLQPHGCINCGRRGWHFGALPPPPERGGERPSGRGGSPGGGTSLRLGAGALEDALPALAVALTLAAGAGWLAVLGVVVHH